MFLTSLVAALPVVALYGWSLYQAVLEAREQGTATVLAHAADAARRVEATLARLDVVSDVLLAREEVAGMDGGRCGASLKDLPRVDPLILNVGLFDLSGRPLCLSRTSPSMPASFRDSAWFRQALAHEARTLTSPYYSPASGRRVLSMTSPVRDGQGRRAGVLGMSIDLERLSGALMGDRLPAGAAVAVVAPDGTLIARNPDPARWIGTQAPAQSLAAAPVSAASGAFRARGVDGIERVIGYASVGAHGWRVYTGVPTAHFAALARENGRRGFGVLAAALLFGVVAAWIGARILARPLQGLTSTARRLAEGDDGARADESQPGEVGQLGAEFNHMVRNLVESRNVERAATARFLQLFNVIPVAATVVGHRSGRVLQANDSFCRDNGVERAQVIGQCIADLRLPACALDAAALQAASGEGVRGLEAVVRTPGQDERTVLLSAEPMAWCGEPALLWVQVDVTEHRRLQQLQAASAAKTEFLSRMSHELRTPLNAILGVAQLLRRDASTQDRHQLDLLNQAGRQLGALIDDILDLSRIEEGRLPVEPRALCLDEFADEAVSLHQPAAREAGVHLRLTRGGPGPVRVLADPVRLRQVLANLVSNAVKYNRRGGEVEVRLASEGARVRLDVRDTGIGLSEGQLASLFQPFNRLGRERSGVPGTGIGLVLTRHLVRLQHGDIEVRSRLDEGTEVSVWLPVAPAAPGSDLQAAAAAAPEPATAPLRGHVLYIEDNPVNAYIVEQLLGVWPEVRVTIAGNGEAGLEQARALQPQVVLLDMQLPDLDGLEVLRRLREDPLTRTQAVIVLSASAMPAEVAAARAAGADDFWAKPFDFDAFLARLRRHLQASA